MAIDPARRLQSLYVPVGDGVRLAVDVWLPVGHIAAGRTVGTVVRTTRYHRAEDLPESAPDTNHAEGGLWNAAGIALVVADARGTGASFGTRTIELGPREVEDYGDLIDWAAAQPWSNGRVGAYGTSYEGQAAELVARLGTPHLVAVGALFSPLDAYRQLFYPGGCATGGRFARWMAESRRKDGVAGALERLSAITGLPPEELPPQPRVKPVDGPDGRVLLAAAVAEHQANVDVDGLVERVPFRDDRLAGLDWTATTPASAREEIESSGVPMLVRAGWTDGAFAAGALARFATFTNRQQVEIGPWAHGGRTHADPLSARGAGGTHPVRDEYGPTHANSSDPQGHSGGIHADPPDSGGKLTGAMSSPEGQDRRLVDFFARHLRPGGSPAGPSTLAFHTLGTDRWQTVSSWPPEGLTMLRWTLDPPATLTLAVPPGSDTTAAALGEQAPVGATDPAGDPEDGERPASERAGGGDSPRDHAHGATTGENAPASPPAADGTTPPEDQGAAGTVRLRVDPAASTGAVNRWLAGESGQGAAYPDRREADASLMTFTSAPVDAALHVVGCPVATLRLAASGDDGAVYVYLEDVAPDGEVTYLTEGCLRFLHRATTGPALPAGAGVPRSFARADRLPVVPGEYLDLVVELQPVAALVRSGHRIRLAIAGHDASCFTRYGPPEETFTLALGTPTTLDLPTLPNTRDPH